MHLDLHRWYHPEETIGVLTILGTDNVLYTIEKPWRGNTPFLSCIPEGNYQLVPHSTLKYPDTWAIVGGTVSQAPNPDFERYACVLHIANLADQLEGCVGPGTGLQVMDGSLATRSSRVAMGILREALQFHSGFHTLTIRGSGVASY